MIKVKKGQEDQLLENIKGQEAEDFSRVDQKVVQIIKRVQEEGDQGIIALTQEIDGISLNGLRVSQEEIESAYQEVRPEVIEALKEASQNIYEFHKHQKEETWTYTKSHGKGSVFLGQQITPIENVGIYIPGGTAAYPSTVLMNGIPAKIAGVKRLVMISPPQKDGNIDPCVLAASKIVGVDEVYKVGGAQGIAALAYGTKTIKKVDKITGPGNIYVARAKQMVFGQVAIDMMAGPSEICVIGDETASPAHIAADLLSQAEHDVMSSCYFITVSVDLAEKVKKEVEVQLKQLSREKIARKSIENKGKIFLVDDLESGFELMNLLGPEHLELMIEEPEAYLNQVKNAGAIFLGPYSSEPLGDYWAGPNHTLPTNGTARFNSPLGVYDFMKRTSIIKYDEEALEKDCEKIALLAEEEGLDGHANAIRVRFKV